MEALTALDAAGRAGGRASAEGEAARRGAGDEPRERDRALVLVGFMGAGKTTAARALAAGLGGAPLDADREIERAAGMTVAELFEREGEAAFRAREEEVVLDLLDRPGARVIALGGGAPTSERVRRALERHVVIHLEVDPEDAWRRVSGGRTVRPLARDRDGFEALHAERAPLYESIADATLPSSDRGAPRRALPALRALLAAPRGTRMTWAASRSAEYPVFLRRGLLAGGFVFPAEGRRIVVTDEHVAAHHRLAAGAAAEIAIPPGESEKTLARAEAVLRAMARSGATRDDLVVALGGGVVGDLAGLCAALYQRGVRCAQVPTTLVAQVDSAYGGKTGVDLPEGKNYAGVYHHPAAVIVDPDVLATLPPAELAAGYAEVVKTALIAGGDLWERVRAGAVDDEDVILACLRTKLAVVREDERDAGRRQVLNLGHTVGHAIESATGYRRYRHGEAVAIGLLCALRLSGADDLRAEVAELFATRGLPLRFEGASVDDVVALVDRDKKRRGDEVPFVLVEAPGRVGHGHRVAAGELRAAVEEVRKP